jgi:transcriptional regulator with XRE-family HTH domain
MPEPDPALGPVLKRLREDRGLTQEALTTRAQITTGTLSKIETGATSCAWITVMQIIDALDVPLVKLAKAVEAERK